MFFSVVIIIYGPAIFFREACLYVFDDRKFNNGFTFEISKSAYSDLSGPCPVIVLIGKRVINVFFQCIPVKAYFRHGHDRGSLVSVFVLCDSDICTSYIPSEDIVEHRYGASVTASSFYHYRFFAGAYNIIRQYGRGIICLFFKESPVVYHFHFGNKGIPIVYKDFFRQVYIRFRYICFRLSSIFSRRDRNIFFREEVVHVRSHVLVLYLSAGYIYGISVIDIFFAVLTGTDHEQFVFVSYGTAVAVRYVYYIVFSACCFDDIPHMQAA